MAMKKVTLFKQYQEPFFAKQFINEFGIDDDIEPSPIPYSATYAHVTNLSTSCVIQADEKQEGMTLFKSACLDKIRQFDNKDESDSDEDSSWYSWTDEASLDKGITEGITPLQLLNENEELSKAVDVLQKKSKEQMVQNHEMNKELLQVKKEKLQLLLEKQQLQQRKEEQMVRNDQIDKELQQVKKEKRQLLLEKQLLQQGKEEQMAQHNIVLQQLQQQLSQLQAASLRNSRTKVDTDTSWKVSYKEVQITRQELGRGGWGVIWIGIFREQKVAVKQMHEAITSRVNLDLLHREINTMAQLRHPNLLQFIGAVFDHPSGNPMIITEIMDTSLRKAYEDKLLTSTKDCLPVSVGIMRDVAVGLNYLHCLPDPIIHRDVSSANVLLESKGNGKWKTKISDFGSANKSKQAMTRATGALIYSAPESIQTFTFTGAKPMKLSTKMDVFSYGVLMCEVLNCKFPDIDAFHQMLQLIDRRCPSLHKLIRVCIGEQSTERPTMKQVIGTIDSSRIL